MVSACWTTLADCCCPASCVLDVECTGSMPALLGLAGPTGYSCQPQCRPLHPSNATSQACSILLDACIQLLPQ